LKAEALKLITKPKQGGVSLPFPWEIHKGFEARPVTSI
jgi:hypothetical protein